LKFGTESFATLIWTTPLLLPVGSIHHTINTLVMWDITSVANFPSYKTTVFHQLCQIAHKTEFCALLRPWGEWQQKQSPELFWSSMRRDFISVCDSRNRMDSSTEKLSCLSTESYNIFGLPIILRECNSDQWAHFFCFASICLYVAQIKI
jgi:hypothetical protein